KYAFVFGLNIEFDIFGSTKKIFELSWHFIDEIPFYILIVFNVLQKEIGEMKNFLPIYGCVPHTEPGHIVSEVHYREFVLVRQYPGAPSYHLKIKGERFCGAIQYNCFHGRFIKTCSQYTNGGQYGIRGIGKPF